MSSPEARLRPIRRTPALRQGVRGDGLSLAGLLPAVFTSDAVGILPGMPTVPGAFPASLGSLVPIADRTADLGVSGLALFVIPAHEGPYGSLAGGEERVGQTESRWLQEVA